MKKRQAINGITVINEAFLGIPVKTIRSQELNSLKPHSRWLYIVLCSKFNRRVGSEKKQYEFTYCELSAITNYDHRRLGSCIKELDRKGFMSVTHGGKNNPSKYRPVLKWLGY